METNQYRVKIEKGDQSFEAEGDKKFVLEMIDRFDVEGIELTKIEQGKGPSQKRKKKPTSEVPERELSVGEFIRQLRVKKHTDVVLSFGYYLEKYRGLKEFTPADINNCYYEAKKEPSNTSQMIIQNIKRTYMMQSKKGAKKGMKKSYMITSAGEENIEKLYKKQSN